LVAATTTNSLSVELNNPGDAKPVFPGGLKDHKSAPACEILKRPGDVVQAPIYTFPEESTDGLLEPPQLLIGKVQSWAPNAENAYRRFDDPAK
jgi:hypothetical protein